MVDTVYQRFGNRLRTVRSLFGVSQLNVAQHCSKSRSAISTIEHGQQSVTLQDVTDLAKALRTTPANLLIGVWTE